MLRSRAARLFTVLAVSAAFNAALTMQNAWPGMGVRPGAGISAELLFLLLLLAIGLERGSRIGRPVVWVLSAFLFLLIIGRYAAVTAHSLFGRPINLYFDLPHMPDVAAMTLGGRPVMEALGITLTLIALPVVLLLAVRWGIGVLAACLSDQAIRRAAEAVAAAGVVAFTAGFIPALHWAGRPFAEPVSAIYAQQTAFLADALIGPRRAAFLSTPPVAAEPAALNGADVFVVFLESYGEVAYRLPEIAADVRTRAVEAEHRLRDRGWQVLTGLFVSPTFGGASWLAHSSFLTGAAVSQNRDYELLLSSNRTSFVSDFARAGYRTVALMPGLKLAWPEGKFYGFDKIYDAAALGYSGPSFGWWEVPDQFTLARLVEQEMEAPGRKPLFVVYPTIMSHMPFAPVPPYLGDWSQALHPAAYARTDNGRSGAAGEGTTRGAYRKAILYDLALIEGFLSERAPGNALIVALGDHQPPGIVSGAGASWLVPVHVFSRDAARIATFRSVGMTDGFVPSGAPIGDFAELHRRFAAALK
jgi:hypothetical protein